MRAGFPQAVRRAFAVALLTTLPMPSVAVPVTLPDVHQEALPGAVAAAYMAIVMDAVRHPEADPVKTYEDVLMWKPIAAERLARVSAKEAYVGVIAGANGLLGGDGTSATFSLSIENGFSLALFMAALSRYVTTSKIDGDTSTGSAVEVYQLTDHGKNIGKLSVAYRGDGSAAVAGTVGYWSEAFFAAHVTQH
jgi:hypothetical protein